jgi:hypothetical protein
MKWAKVGLIVAIWFLVGVLVSQIARCWDIGAWQIVEAIASWLLVLGIVFAIWQINETKKSTNAQIAVELFKELRNEKALETLRFIYTLSPDNPAIVFNSDKYRIEYLLDRMNFLSLLVKNGIVDLNLAIDTYAGASFLRCWYVLHSSINDIREDQKRQSYCFSFEGFTHLCMNNFTRRGMKVGFKNKYCKENECDDLVKTFKDAEKEYKKENGDEKKRKLYPRSWGEIEKDYGNKK